MTVHIGGVPEHFNLPWHYALEKDWFKQNGIDLRWTDYPGGTGAMNKDLRSGVLDVAVILTEGIVADNINGNSSKIVQWYVKSPLIWGIHTGAHSAVENEQQFKGKKYAISRYGSGSHLMAFVDAHQRGFEIQEEQFVVVNNLDGAVKALSEGKADLFMWEKFMTKPYVDNGSFRRVGECPTPWPSFVIAVREEFLNENKKTVAQMLATIQQACKEFYFLPDVAERISTRFKLTLPDVKEWMKTIRWQTESEFDREPLEKVMDTLVELKIVGSKVELEKLCG
jgi:sulfonate transport system substrate-binding protein